MSEQNQGERLGEAETPKPVHVGMHISRAEVAAASVVGGKGDWSIGAAAALPLPRGTIEGDTVVNEEMTANVMQAVWKIGRFPDRPATLRLAIEGPQVTFTRRPESKELTVKVSAGLTRGVIQQLGKASTGQVVMTAPEELTAAVRRATVGWGIGPAIVPSGFAAVRAAGPNDDKARIIIFVDGERTTVVLQQEGKVSLIRSYDGTGHSSRVEAWMRKGTPVSPNHIADIATQAVEASYGPTVVAGDDLGSARLGGPAARLPGLAESMSSRLGVPVEVADPIYGKMSASGLTPSQLEEVAPRLIVPVGAALLGASGSRADLP